MKPVLKRGYYKWIDEKGIRHKVREEDYEEVNEYSDEDDYSFESD